MCSCFGSVPPIGCGQGWMLFLPLTSWKMEGTRNLRRIMWLFIVLGFVMMTVTVDSVNMRGKQRKKPVVSSPVDLFVGITVVEDAMTKGAVCLDGSPPAYNLHRGFGSGRNSWLIHMEGGGWCHNITSCSKRAHSQLGSSVYMGAKLAFSGILSDNVSQNPGFYNWNRVKIRYCDGASFTGDVEKVNQIYKLYYRGQRIWQVVMDDLLLKGMDKANEAMLSGCSAGGLTSFLHCDNFRNLLPKSATVKCLGDGGFFLDSLDISDGHYIRDYFNKIITLQGSAKNLPRQCTSKLDPIQCFFPQYLLPYTETPVFVLNAAYDSWQIKNILAPSEADPYRHWQLCKLDIKNCNSHQLQKMQGYRSEMLRALKLLETYTSSGMFINSCYAHCQTEMQDLWHSPNSPRLNSKTIAESVGDWFFNREVVKAIDCPYPCDSTCHNRVFTEDDGQ